MFPFCQTGGVTGIDLSRRFIAYAKEKAAAEGLVIQYDCMNYLAMDFGSEFDEIIVIYCDFAVLSTANRRLLLQKIYRALKPGGRCILDVFTPQFFAGKEESTSWEVAEQGGF